MSGQSALYFFSCAPFSLIFTHFFPSLARDETSRTDPPPPVDLLPRVARLRSLAPRRSPPPRSPSPSSSLASPPTGIAPAPSVTMGGRSKLCRRRSASPVILRPNKPSKWVCGELLILLSPFPRGFRRRAAQTAARHGLAGHDRSDRFGQPVRPVVALGGFLIFIVSAKTCRLHNKLRKNGKNTKLVWLDWLYLYLQGKNIYSCKVSFFYPC